MKLLFCKWDNTCIEALLRRGVEVFVVLDDYDFQHININKELLKSVAGVSRISSFDSLEELSAVAIDFKIRKIQINHVASFAEHSQYGAAYLERLLGVNQTSFDLAMAARDKRMMKQLVTTSGIKTAHFISIGDNENAPNAKVIMQKLGSPVVVKPVSGVGTASTMLIKSHTHLEWELSNRTDKKTIFTRQLIVEQFIDGDEYHIDAVWREGKEWIFVVGKYFIPCLKVINNPEFNGGFYVPEEKYQEFYNETREFHKQINNALGIKSGVTHLEFFQKTSGELCFSEIGIRPGGGNTSETVKAYCGVDLREIWIEEMTDGTKRNLSFSKPLFPYVGWINVKPQHFGIIRRVPRDEEILKHKNVIEFKWLKNIGDRVESSGPVEWCLLLVIGAHSEFELIDISRKLQYELIIETA